MKHAVIPAPDDVDDEDAEDQHEHLHRVRQKPAVERLLQRKPVDRRVDRGHPCVHTVGDAVGRSPDHPDDQRALEIDRREQLLPIALLRRTRDRRHRHRGAFFRARLDLPDDRFRFLEPALADQPARRFRQGQQQERDDEPRDRAEHEQGLPAVDRYELSAEDSRGEKAERKDQLIGEEEAAAMLRARQLVDVGRRDWHLATDANAL
jgi:hypothetical protein